MGGEYGFVFAGKSLDFITAGISAPLRLLPGHES
jgi:hypothetical protein